MNAPIDAALLRAASLQPSIDTACERIAPTWPLDQFIAVNPYWGWVGRPIEEAAAALGTLAGTRLTLPQAVREAWAGGRLRHEHLLAAIEAEGAAVAVDTLVAAVQKPSAELPRLPLLTDLREAGAPPRPGISWTDAVTHQISQHCAAWFDRDQAAWRPSGEHGLLGSWCRQLGSDHGLAWRQGQTWLRTRLSALPATPQALIGEALDALGIADAGRDAYLSAVLMSINGWAAWCAYERWQARLGGGDDAQIVELLAIRLAWEWLLYDDAEPGSVPASWAARWAEADAQAAALRQTQRNDWLLQRAFELAYQQALADGLRRAEMKADDHGAPPAVQAVFCIDVRSEVFRRALEAASPAVHTRGFAGFFGLPIAYSPVGSTLTRPQLPGLLAPAACVSEADAGSSLGQALARKRRGVLQWRQRWADFRATPSSAFSFVETLGLLYAPKLLAESLPSTRPQARWEDDGLSPSEAAGLRPCLALATQDPAAAAAMAKGILGAMGLVDGFAPLVLLAGHGSHTANNPHAAGLDCGACGGQTGEVNARVLADLLNQGAVRAELSGLGIHIPSGTHFVPALHNTTTDQVLLYDTDAVPAALHGALDALRGWLQRAGELARAERAPSLGLEQRVAEPAALAEAVYRRANDWAQVRPEWGLVDNAAFIVAPRSRSRHLQLQGRSFLHDYDWRLDPELAVLTLIMTAPMVVTNWINLQYHASTVDNRRYGSGNKLLHNVVGGRIGVFEGNGGDLRIGLPLQSLHDGRELRHTPLRLSVFIEAPRAAIDAVMAAHPVVQQLVGNGWLHLLRIEPLGSRIEAWRRGEWYEMPPAQPV